MSYTSNMRTAVSILVYNITGRRYDTRKSIERLAIIRLRARYVMAHARSCYIVQMRYFQINRSGISNMKVIAKRGAQ